MDTREKFKQAQQHMLNRYEVDAQSRFIDVPLVDGQAHILVNGEGPGVVMINGIGTPGAMFAPLMAELNGFTLFVVDLPGYGLTDTFDTFAENLQENAVRFLNEVIGSLELESPPVLANSLGSLFASWLALKHPGKVSALIHIGCPALVLDTSAPFPMRLLSVTTLGPILTRLQPPSNKQVEQLSKMVKEYPLVPELADLLVKTEQLSHFRHTFLSTLHELLRLRGSRPKMRFSAKQLAQITQPVLLIWGKDDPFGSPEVGNRMTEFIPSAELHVVDGGHAPWLKQSKHIAPIITRFLHQHVKKCSDN